MHNFKIKSFLFFACILFTINSSHGQELTWAVDFNTIFDNREGDDKYTDTKTFFQTKLAPEIGVSMMDGMHRISGGVVWTQPIGSEWDGYKLSPTL